jgi:SAM-dependent methyltransferase
MGAGPHGEATALDLWSGSRPKETVVGLSSNPFHEPREAIVASSGSPDGLAGPFAVAAEHYDRFMGRYAGMLAAALADVAGVSSGMRVLDVGCGPGGLTRELCRRVGAERVAAIDPMPQFVMACRERHPGADVREGVAEELPWSVGEFDATLSCLVIGFMSDPDRGVREMARVTRPGGTVAACMWDVASGGMTMLRVFWNAVRQLNPDVEGERRLAGTVEGDIVARFTRAGLHDVVGRPLTATAGYADFDDFWEPFTFAVGPAGRYLASLSDVERARVREASRAQLPEGSFSLAARAWCARGAVPTH